MGVRTYRDYRGVVECDGQGGDCGERYWTEEYYERESEAEDTAKEMAREAGWYLANGGGLELCPECRVAEGYPPKATHALRENGRASECGLPLDRLWEGNYTHAQADAEKRADATCVNCRRVLDARMWHVRPLGKEPVHAP